MYDRVFLEAYCKLRGLPDDNVSDRDLRFTSGFWLHFTRLWGTRTTMSTSFYPQTDRQGKNAHRIVEHYLRTCVAANERH